MKSFKLYLFIGFVSLLPLIDIFIHSDLPHTSDGAMHIARFAAYYKEFISGQFPVRWASQFNFGYGTPIFNFFSPLPYFMGIPLIALGFSLVNTLKISFAISYILAGIFMLLFARAFFRDDMKAVLITVMYQFAPFRLVEMLVRGNLGSLYSYSLLPLVLYGIIQFNRTKNYSSFLIISISTALLALSHNVIGFVFFGLSFIFTLYFPNKIKNKLISLIPLFWGLSIAAFFLIPAILEHKYTNGYLFTKDLFYQHFTPLYKFFVPNIFNSENLRIAEVSVQFGIFHEIALVISAIILLLKRNAENKKIYIFSIIITIITLFFMSRSSLLFWENISILRQFQYPWRLLAIICFLTAFTSIGYFEIPLFSKKIFYWLFILLVIFSTYIYWIPYQGYMKADQSFYWNYPLNTNYFGEVNSIWMGNEPSQYPKSRVEIASGNAQISDLNIQPLKHTFHINVKTDSTIVDNTQFYPGWKVLINNKSIPIEFQNQNYRGLITYNLPKGIFEVIVKYSENKLEKLSDYISIFSIILLILIWFSRNKFNQILNNNL